MMVFWLVRLFMSFGLFVRPNVTVVSSLLISALAPIFMLDGDGHRYADPVIDSYADASSKIF